MQSLLFVSVCLFGLHEHREFTVNKPIQKVMIAYSLDIKNHPEIQLKKVIKEETKFDLTGVYIKHEGIYRDTQHCIDLKFNINISPNKMVYTTTMLTTPSWHVAGGGATIVFSKIGKNKTKVVIDAWSSLRYRRALFFPRRRMRLGSGIKTSIAAGMLNSTTNQLVCDVKRIANTKLPSKTNIKELMSGYSKGNKKGLDKQRKHSTRKN